MDLVDAATAETTPWTKSTLLPDLLTAPFCPPTTLTSLVAVW